MQVIELLDSDKPQCLIIYELFYTLLMNIPCM